MRVNPALEGVIVTDTEISLIDGEQGRLIYRGYDIQQLVHQHTFEEVIALLWTGKLPEPTELHEWKQQIYQYSRLPLSCQQVISLIPSEVDMMSVLRATLASLGDQSFSWPLTQKKALQLFLLVPLIIAARYRFLQGKDMVEPRPDLSFAANYLYMITGKEPHPAHARAIESYFILTAEHGLNASTFTARVVASTEADLSSVLIAAMGALKGRLHGGAPSEVDDMLIQIQDVTEAERWLRERLDRGEKLMGFGHRLYRTIDPRAEALREVVKAGAGDEPWFHLAIEVERIALSLLKEYKPHRQIHTNVEFYTAAILKAIELPKELYTPTFAVSRTVGWIAHILEQAKHNRIIRPDARYVGPEPVQAMGS